MFALRGWLLSLVVVAGTALPGLAPAAATPEGDAQPVRTQRLAPAHTGGNEIPEQHLVYAFTGDFDAEILSRSSRTGGQPLLGDAEIRALSAILQRLHSHFVPKWRGPANAVDVEFLIAGEDRHVVILQARPYTVTYGPGQRMEDAPSDHPGGGPGLLGGW